jgi:trimethylamine--corrinoid protein Co-methyltransferase
MAVIVQLINPGNPLLLGFCPACIDMRTAYATFGCPENALVSAAGAQMLRYYNLPSWCCASEVDSIIPDAQTGYETVWNTLLSVISGMNVISGTGHLGAAGGSLEKLVIDNEVLGGMKRILRGVEVTGETLAVDVIDAVGPGGQYLSQKHSRVHLRNERWFPKLSYKSNLEEWKRNRIDLWGRAKKEVIEVLRTHRPEPLPGEIEEKIKSIARRAESGIPDPY